MMAAIMIGHATAIPDIILSIVWGSALVPAGGRFLNTKKMKKI